MSEELAKEDTINDEAGLQTVNERADSPADAGESNDAETEDTRRAFFVIGSWICGAIVSIGPVLIGLAAFLDPLGKRKPDPLKYREDETGGDTNLIRVAALSAISERPQRFPVISNLRDSWNFAPGQPIGSVYVQRVPAEGEEEGGAAQLRVFNTTCPHAGCSVDCDGKAFICPCHNSAFNLDGTKRDSAAGVPNPSPRDLDALDFEVRDDQVWVEFKNFYTGKHEQKVKK